MTKNKMTREEHKRRHVELHAALDELLADFITHNPGPILNRPIKELLTWASEQRDNPTEVP